MAPQEAIQLSPKDIQAIQKGPRSEREEPTCTMDEAFNFARESSASGQNSSLKWIEPLQQLAELLVVLPREDCSESR